MRQRGRKIGRDRISSVKSVWKECSFSSAQFQTPHRAKGSRGRYGLLPRECLSRSRKVAEREGEREEEKKGGGGGLVGRSGAQSVGVSRLPSVLSPTRSVDRSTPCYRYPPDSCAFHHRTSHSVHATNHRFSIELESSPRRIFSYRKKIGEMGSSR